MIPRRRRRHLVGYCLVFLGIDASYRLPAANSFQLQLPSAERSRSLPLTLTTLRANPSTNKSSSNDGGDKKATGVYVRPSAAVERGSGFFFPGLEGPRVRLVVGSLLLVVTGVNHVLSSSTSLFSEALAVLYSLLVLLQGAIETSKEGRIETIAARTTTTAATQANSNTSSQLSQQWSASATNESSESWKARVEWSAATYLSLTPATHMMLLRRQSTSTSTSAATATASIDYWLGVTGIPTPITDTMKSAAVAALDAIQKSSSGRVALPSDHPATVGLAPEGYRRCLVLQRISSDTCWMVASDDLLASFTQQDLQWLGQLARYVDEHDSSNNLQ